MTPASVALDAQAEIVAVVERTLREVGAEFATLDRATVIGDLKVDSLDLLVLAETLEERFAVRISAEDLFGIKTVGDAVDLVLERSGQGG